MHLRLDLEEYFKYHPPTTPERIALHSKVNEITLECCKELFAAIDYEDKNLDLELESMNRRCLSQEAITKVLSEIDSIVQDQTCATWAKNALHSADVYACGQYKEGVLMAIQQCTMFLNKGVTLDSLANAKLNT